MEASNPFSCFPAQHLERQNCRNNRLFGVSVWSHLPARNKQTLIWVRCSDLECFLLQLLTSLKRANPCFRIPSCTFPLALVISSLIFHLSESKPWIWKEKIFSRWKCCVNYKKESGEKVLRFPKGNSSSELNSPLGHCSGHAQIDLSAANQCSSNFCRHLTLHLILSAIPTSFHRWLSRFLHMYSAYHQICHSIK